MKGRDHPANEAGLAMGSWYRGLRRCIHRLSPLDQRSKASRVPSGGNVTAMQRAEKQGMSQLTKSCPPFWSR